MPDVVPDFPAPGIIIGARRSHFAGAPIWDLHVRLGPAPELQMMAGLVVKDLDGPPPMAVMMRIARHLFDIGPVLRSPLSYTQDWVTVQMHGALSAVKRKLYAVDEVPPTLLVWSNPLGNPTAPIGSPLNVA